MKRERMFGIGVDIGIHSRAEEHILRFYKIGDAEDTGAMRRLAEKFIKKRLPIISVEYDKRGEIRVITVGNL